MTRTDRAGFNAAVKAAETALVPLVSEANAEEAQHDENVQNENARHTLAIGQVMVRIAIQINAGKLAKDALGQSWRDWAVKATAGLRKSIAGPTLYRVQNAGAVAEIIGESVGEAAYTALVPLYRLVVAGSEESAQRVRDLWAQACEASAPFAPTEESVRQLVESVAPKGTRGKAGKDAKGRKNAQQAKNARSRNTPTETTENGGKGNTETVEIDKAAVESCQKALPKFVKALAVEHSTTEDAIRAIMLATLRLSEVHGPVAMEIVLAGKSK